MASLERGHRGAKVLFYNNFRYQKNKVTQTKIHWRCWREDCRAYLQTRIFDLNEEQPNIHVISVQPHGHSEDLEVIETQRVKSMMEDAIQDDPSRPIKRIYNEVVAGNYNDVDDDNIPSYEKLKSSLKRTRAHLLPPIPDDVEDVRIEDEWGVTWAGRRFLSRLDNDWGIVVFATNENYRKLYRCTDVYMDGTFKTPYNKGSFFSSRTA